MDGVLLPMINLDEYSLPKQYSIPRTLYEVYKTDEENFEQYIPKSSNEEAQKKEEEKEEDETDDETEEDTSEEESDEEDEGFTLHQGEIIETYYYTGFVENNYESDYEDISDTATIKLPEIKDLNRFYLGVRTRLLKKWENYGETTNAEEMNEVFKGFITEEKFNEEGMELSLSGMTKLLEQEYQFEFTQMLRSKIIEEVIKTAGLKPVVDPTGLDDQIIDYTNISKSGDSDDTSYGNLPAEACNGAKKLTKGKKSKRDKAQAIYDWIDGNFPYYGYNNSHYNEQNIYSTALANIGKKIFNCCDHAHLSVVMLRCVGLKANYIHVYGHVYTVVYLEEGRVMFDPLGYGRPMGSVASGYAKDGPESESINF